MKKFLICFFIGIFLGCTYITITLAADVEVDAGRRTYCSNCGTWYYSGHSCHTHDFTTCKVPHCKKTYCSNGPCKKSSHSCDPCSYGEWQVSDTTGKHYRQCTKSGCTKTKSKHDPKWEAISGEHAFKCTYSGCTIEESHTPMWPAEYTEKDEKHVLQCAFGKGAVRCETYKNQHEGDFSGAYYKLNDGDDSDRTSSHETLCQYNGCTIKETHLPDWGEWYVDEDEDEELNAICGKCGLICKGYSHAMYSYIDIDKHLARYRDPVTGWILCYREAPHVDKENGADGKCDKCNGDLYQITYSPSNENGLVNTDVIVTVTMKDTDGNDVVLTETYDKNGSKTFDFNVKGINKKIDISVDYINKSVAGRTYAEKLSNGKVRVTFLPDYEKETYGDYSKTITAVMYEEVDGNYVVRASGDAAKGADGKWPISYDFSESARGYVYMKDTVGNEKNISFKVDIASGTVTTAAVSDILENGTVFTDILINTKTDGWQINNADSQIEVKIYKVTDNGIELQTYNPGQVKISKMGIQNYDESPIAEPDRGLYYINVGIGGPGVFTIDEGKNNARYILEVVAVRPVSGGANINGGNRIEVIVNKLNNLT